MAAYWTSSRFMGVLLRIIKVAYIGLYTASHS